ncbi:hypothetical protein DPO11_26960 [Salmonella enterica]|nr:hypothetical protein [Salmonella enterica]
MIRLEMTGLDELDRQLQALGEDIALNVIRDAGKAAMVPVEQDMKRNAGYDPSNTGEHMRDSITTRSRSRIKDGNWPTVMTFSTGPSSAHTMKAIAQEYGTVKQVADPFMRPALDNNIPKVINTLSEKIRQAIHKRG